MILTVLAACVAGTTLPAVPTTSPTQQAAIDAAQHFETLLAQAVVVGTPDKPQLIVPIDLPEEARAFGIEQAFRTYKGMCGPNGAQATVQDLLDHARRDFEQENGLRVANEFVGQSPRFELVYDSTNPAFVGFYLPPIRQAANYIAISLDNRTDIRVSVNAAPISSGAIGTASTTHYTLSWSVYVDGLRSQSLRDNPAFANALPTAPMPVVYSNGSTGSASTVSISDGQFRAIFGSNAIGPTTATTLTFNTGSDWEFFGCDEQSGSELSLIDVAVHEFTHGIGFSSSIDTGGSSFGSPRGLDIARFRIFNLPFNLPSFASQPRIASGFTNELHYYYSYPNAFVTSLESGDANQPSHLEYRQSFNTKLGVMDPVMNYGESRCPNYWTRSDYQPLDDMGWRVIINNPTSDCNGNGRADFLDIIVGTSLDVDGDVIPDECETFYNPAPGTQGAQGIHRTVYLTPGLTDLANFNPAAPGVTILSSTLEPTMSTTAVFPNSAQRVTRARAFVYLPTRDEYAFRVDHPTGHMRLSINGVQIGSTSRAGGLDYHTSGGAPSTQHFVQLQPGWHQVDILTLTAGPSATIRLVHEARNIGTWIDIPPANLRALALTDCDANGVDDALDPDCDGDGKPDGCELDCNDDGIPDECQNILPAQAQDLGVVGTPDAQLTYATCGSTFDTAIAIYSETGDYIDSNYNGCGQQSTITRRLPAGTYYICFAGQNTSFNADFSIRNNDAIVGNCSPGGTLTYTVGSLTRTEPFPTGLYAFARFTIANPPCEADLNNDGTLNFFDVSAFLNAFNTQQPLADLAAPFGTFNFFDVSAYLAAYAAGCP